MRVGIHSPAVRAIAMSNSAITLLGQFAHRTGLGPSHH